MIFYFVLFCTSGIDTVTGSAGCVQKIASQFEGNLFNKFLFMDFISNSDVL